MNKFSRLAIIGIVFFLVPLQAMAHGTEEHAAEESVNYWTYGWIASAILLAISLALYMAKRVQKNRDTSKKKKGDTEGSLYKWLSIITAALTAFFVLMANVTGEEHLANEGNITFTHIHGLGYTSNGEALYVPAHDGLKVYKDGDWISAEAGEAHDYMGFNMVADGFYSSGHPAAGSELANPLGIVKSTDGGENLELLDLYKEIDFHGLAVGYETNDIYVFNPEQNSRMDEPGFYYSTDETATWTQGALQGLEGQAMAFGAHPTEEGIVAVGTDQGLFLSDNYGDTFEALAVAEAVSAVSFGFENNLLAAVQTAEKSLVEIDVASGEMRELQIPDLAGDVVTYVQQNPAYPEEYVFATAEKDIYFSHDNGETWEQSVENGEEI